MAIGRSGRTGFADVAVHAGDRSSREEPPAPPWVLFEALTQPHRDPARLRLTLLHDEVELEVVEADEPHLVVWSSPWTRRPDARVRFDLLTGGASGGTNLRWTLLTEEPAPDAALEGHLCKRLNQLIKAELRYSLGQ